MKIKPLAFDQIDGAGQFMFDGVIASLPDWSKRAESESKGIRITMGPGTRYRVEVTDHAIKPGEVKYLDNSSLVDPCTLRIG